MKKNILPKNQKISKLAVTLAEKLAVENQRFSAEIERLKEALRKIAYIRDLNPELKATEFSVDAETELKNFYCTMGDIAKIALANTPDTGKMEEN